MIMRKKALVPLVILVAGVLIVGTNLGGLGPTYPFDPDFAPYEPHGYAVHLAKL